MHGERSPDGGRAITTGGVTALVGKMFHAKKRPKSNRLDNSTERRNEYAYGDEQDGTFEGRATG